MAEIALSQHIVDDPEHGRLVWVDVVPYPYPDTQLFSDCSLEMGLGSGLVSWSDAQGVRWAMLGTPPVVLYRLAGARDPDSDSLIGEKYASFLSHAPAVA